MNQEKNNIQIKDELGNISKSLLAEVISREEYLNALELIDKYHRQSEVITVKPDFNKSISNSERGDFVICKYVNGANKKCLTKGKTYEIIDFYGWKNSKDDFYIIDDNGKIKRYDVCGVQFSAV